MGEQNSSITRVWPVFLHLIQNDSTGRKWLPTILKAAATSSGNRSGEYLAAFESPLHPELVSRPREPRSINGYTGLYLPPCFERRLPPPEAFLRWLIQ